MKTLLKWVFPSWQYLMVFITAFVSAIIGYESIIVGTAIFTALSYPLIRSILSGDDVGWE